MKHIKVKYHFIKSHISQNTLKIVYMPTAQMTVDIFTKFLPPPKYALHSKYCNLTTSPLKGVCEKYNKRTGIGMGKDLRNTSQVKDMLKRIQTACPTLNTPLQFEFSTPSIRASDIIRVHGNSQLW